MAKHTTRTVHGTTATWMREAGAGHLISKCGDDVANVPLWLFELWSYFASANIHEYGCNDAENMYLLMKVISLCVPHADQLAVTYGLGGRERLLNSVAMILLEEGSGAA